MYVIGGMSSSSKPKAFFFFMGFKCLRCGWQWFPRRGKEPRQCPKCRSFDWRKPPATPRQIGRKDRHQTLKFDFLKTTT
jgi:predicted Zn-ribbon and HTH transcriptional regulator